MRHPTVRGALFWLPAQPVIATHALKFSADVSNSNVFLGRSFSWRARGFMTLRRHVTSFSGESSSLRTQSESVAVTTISTIVPGVGSSETAIQARTG